MSHEVLVKNPWRGSWLDISDKFTYTQFNSSESVDAKSKLDIDIEYNDAINMYFSSGTLVSVRLSKNGVLPDHPDFVGFCINDMERSISKGSTKGRNIFIEGLGGVLDRIIFDKAIKGENFNSAIALALTRAWDPKTFEQFFDVETRLKADAVIPDIEADETIYSILTQLVGDQVVVDDTDAMNIRFAHFYFKHRMFQYVPLSTMVVEMEKNVKEGYDFLLTDDDIDEVEMEALDLQMTELITKVGQVRREIQFQTMMRDYGRNVLYSKSDKDESVDYTRRALLRLVKDMNPTNAITVHLSKQTPIQLNSRVKIESEDADINDTFIVLGKDISAGDEYEVTLRLGYNLQNLEDFLNLK